MTHSLLTSDPPVVLDARVTTDTGGGPEKTILNSPRFLAPLGYRMVCAFMHPPGDPGFQEQRRKAERWRAPLVSVPDRGPWDLRVLRQMLALCRRERVRIWHAHDYKSNTLGLLLKPFWPMRLVTTVHGWGVLGPRLPLYYRIDRRCLPRYERVVCVSEKLYEECLECGVDRRRCVLVENGIDTEEFRRHHGRDEAKRRLGIPPGRWLIGAAGRLSAEKGFDLLIRCVDDLARRGLDVGLVIVGKGEEGAALRGLVTDLRLADRVHLAGYQADLRPFYEAMDAYALSSYSEGLPNVLLEAMALEVPVVATRVGGVPRLITDGENGLLVQPHRGEDLSCALLRLRGNHDLRAYLARAGRRTIEDQYSFGVRMRNLAAMYDELLTRRRRTTTAEAAPRRALVAT
jgi:glycosyltransferase involved in cell wall biosynthesis